MTKNFTGFTMASFLRNIQNTAHRFNLWKRGDKILVAVSGGPDSISLLDGLFCLGKKYEWMLHIAHVNYGLRGVDSDADEQFVRERASFYDIPFSTLHPKKSSLTANLESHLRTIRYSFFEKTRKKHGCDSIAVAHNEDDQAETFLLRVLRGSGLRGLGAMRPNDGVVIRPLLLTSKRDILRYLEEKNLSYRVDSTNTQPIFTRNRIRLELIPFLETFNPNIRKTLAENALSFADDSDFFSIFLRENFSFLQKEELGFSVSVKVMNSLHPAVSRSIFRYISEETGAYKQPPSFGEIEEMRKICTGSKNKNAQKTFQGLKLTRKGDRVFLFVS